MSVSDGMCVCVCVCVVWGGQREEEGTEALFVEVFIHPALERRTINPALNPPPPALTGGGCWWHSLLVLLSYIVHMPYGMYISHTVCTPVIAYKCDACHPLTNPVTPTNPVALSRQRGLDERSGYLGRRPRQRHQHQHQFFLLKCA